MQLFSVCCCFTIACALSASNTTDQFKYNTLYVCDVVGVCILYRQASTSIGLGRKYLYLDFIEMPKNNGKH